MKLFRQSAAYMVANLLAATIGFASVMALTRLVEPAEYGVYVVVAGIGTVLSTVGFTWLRHAVMRFQSDPTADVRMSVLAGYAITLFVFPVVFAVLVLVFGVSARTSALALAFAAAIMLYELGQELLRARQHVKVQSFASVSRAGLALLFSLAAIAAGFGGIGIVGGMIAGYVSVAVASSPSVWAGPRKPFDSKTLLALASYGLPITLSGLFVGANLSVDRLVLAAMHGAETAGIYGAIADFVRQCAILPAISASMAIAPIAVAALAENKSGTVVDGLRDGVELLLAVLLPTVVGLAIAAPEVSAVILGPAYRATAVTLIPIVGCAFMAHMISQQYVQLSFTLANRPGYFILHTGLIFAINLALIVPLVRQFGPHGAGLSLLVSEAAGVVIGYLFARRVFPLPLGVRRLSRVAGSVLFMSGVALLARQLPIASDVLRLVTVVAAGVVSYVAAAYAFDVVRIRVLIAGFLSRPAVHGAPR